MEAAAGDVSDQESAAAGPGQCAASHLPEDQDAGGLCSLVLQGFAREQSTIPVTRREGQRSVSDHLCYAFACQLGANRWAGVLWFVCWKLRTSTLLNGCRAVFIPSLCLGDLGLCSCQQILSDYLKQTLYSMTSTVKTRLFILLLLGPFIWRSVFLVMGIVDFFLGLFSLCESSCPSASHHLLHLSDSRCQLTSQFSQFKPAQLRLSTCR